MAHAGTIAPLVRYWIGARDAFARYLGAAACLAHGIDPKDMLGRLVRDPDARVRATSLRLAGTLRRADLMREISEALEADHERVRIWSALGRSTNLARAIWRNRS